MSDLRLMIVDDFEADRLAMRRLVQGLRMPQLSIACECKSGAEALEAARHHAIDVCLCDINMPGMNGFQLARALRLMGSEARIIFCSMYSEFEYAKQAMYLDSYGYVLKPVNPDELRECLSRVSLSISAQLRADDERERLLQAIEDTRPLMRELFVRDLVSGLSKDPAAAEDALEFHGLAFLKGPVAVALVEIDDYRQLTRDMSVQERQLLSMRVSQRITASLPQGTRFAMAKMDDSHFSMVFSAEGTAASERLARLCGGVVALFDSADISVSLALSDVGAGVRGVPLLAEQCEYILRHKFSLGKARVLTAQDVRAGVKPIAIDLNALRRDVQYALNAPDDQEVERLAVSLTPEAAALSEAFHSQCAFVETVIRMELGDQGIATPLPGGGLPDAAALETLMDIRDWLRERIGAARQLILEKAESQESALVRRIKQLVKAQLDQPLNLDSVARELYYTPNYLNSVFKRVTGETITDYLTNKRMERAKDLLLDPRYKLYEVAQALQYSHTTYFSRVFQKHAGMTPREYRERHALGTFQPEGEL